MSSEKCEMVLDDIKTLKDDDNEYCIDKKYQRLAVGCYSKHLRETTGSNYSDSMKEAWAVVKKYTCS